MYPQYARMLNGQTESISSYVLLKEDNDNFLMMNPITYFWLKYLNKLELAHQLAEDYDTLFFTKATGWDINSVVEEKYMNTYKRYFEKIKINEENINELPDITHYLEFYQGNSRITNQYNRIYESLVSHKSNHEKYVSILGPVLRSLCEMDGKLENGDYLKMAFNDRLESYLCYLET